MTQNVWHYFVSSFNNTEPEIFPSVQQDIIYEHQWFEAAGATFFPRTYPPPYHFATLQWFEATERPILMIASPRSFSRFRPQNFHRTFLRETLWSGLFLFKFWTKVFFQGIVCYSTVIDVFVQRWPLPTTIFPKFRDRKYKKHCQRHNGPRNWLRDLD